MHTEDQLCNPPTRKVIISYMMLQRDFTTVYVCMLLKATLLFISTTYVYTLHNTVPYIPYRTIRHTIRTVWFTFPLFLINIKTLVHVPIIIMLLIIVIYSKLLLMALFTCT